MVDVNMADKFGTDPVNTVVDADGVPVTKDPGGTPAGDGVALASTFRTYIQDNFVVPADFIDAITEIAASLKTGADLTLVTGTAGVSGDLALWNVDGDLVDGPTPPSGAIVGTTDTQTLSGKTLTTPVIAQINDANGNEALTLAATASAVNYLEAVNSATGNDVSLDAKGGDTDIGIALTPKGAGNITLGTIAIDADQALTATEDNFVLTYDDATGLASFEAASGGGGSPGGADGQVQYNNAGAFAGANVWVEDANTLALRNGANAQEVRVYSEFTDAANNSYLGITSPTSDEITLASEANGTGSERRVRIKAQRRVYIDSGYNGVHQGLHLLENGSTFTKFEGGGIERWSGTGRIEGFIDLFNWVARSSDASPTINGRFSLWQSDGTATGNSGELIIANTNSAGNLNTHILPHAGAVTDHIATSEGTTGGTGSAGAGSQYVELRIGGAVYKVLHDGTV